MGSALTYKIIAKVYDLLDVTYFIKQNTSPRQAVYEFIEETNVRVLDICTGTAANAVYISERIKESKVVGIDLSKDMLKIANTKIKKKHLKNVELHVKDATKTEFKDETFDVVLISLVLHEIDKSLAEQIILEARRVLKEDGQIIVVEWEKPQKLFQKIMFLPILWLEPKGFVQFLKLDMKQYFGQYGLNLENIKHCDYTKVIRLKKQ